MLLYGLFSASYLPYLKLTIKIGHFVLSHQAKNDKQKLKEAENHLPDNAHNAS